MIIEYKNNKIMLNTDELVKASVAIAANSFVLFIAKEAFTNLASSGESYYKDYCTSYTDSVPCFTNYSRIETSNFLNSLIDKVGGVVAFAALLYVARETVGMGCRKISQNRSSLPAQVSINKQS